MKKAIAAIITGLFLFSPISHAETRIEINLPAHSLSLYEDGVKTHAYPVAIGKPSTPTPISERSVISMEEDPIWTDPETMESYPSDDWNPLGYRWLGIGGRYGIHGNSNPASIGTSVSNGCVRMYNEDVEELYELVDVGTPVDIVYERVVVERSDDGQVSLYIYPDCYDEQDLSVYDVRHLLDSEVSGSSGFLTDDEIEMAIDNEDGEQIPVVQAQPLSVGKTNLWVFERGGEKLYPIEQIASALKVPVRWNSELQQVIGRGIAKGKQLGGLVFVTSPQSVEQVLPVRMFQNRKTNIYRVVPVGTAERNFGGGRTVGRT